MISGANIYIQDDKPFLFIYKKFQNNEVNKLDSNNYICVVFDDDGRDYIGQMNLNKITEMLNIVENISIIEKDYEIIPILYKKYINNEVYDYWKKFSIEQLDNI